jgi:hypothetical protein
MVQLAAVASYEMGRGKCLDGGLGTDKLNNLQRSRRMSPTLKSIATDSPGRELGQGIIPRIPLAMRAQSLLRGRPTVAKAALSIVDQGIVSGTSFATAVIVGRACAPDQLGRYYLTLTIVMLALGIQENLVSGPYTVLSARRRGRELAEFTGSAWLLLGSLIAGGLLLLTVLLGAWSIAGASGSTPGLWVLLAVGPLLLLRDAVNTSAGRVVGSMVPGSDVAVRHFWRHGGRLRRGLCWLFGPEAARATVWSRASSRRLERKLGLRQVGPAQLFDR